MPSQNNLPKRLFECCFRLWIGTVKIRGATNRCCREFHLEAAVPHRHGVDSNKLHDRGINVAAEDLAHLSPYPTSKVKRFGDYPAQVITDSRPSMEEESQELLPLARQTASGWDQGIKNSKNRTVFISTK